MGAWTTNTELIEACLRNKINLVGVFSKDQLPKKGVDGCYIVNMSDHDKGHGTHWVGFIIQKKKACYYDSFGVSPPKAVQHFLKPYVPYCYNNTQLQNINSGVCGYFVVHWLYYMTKPPAPDLNSRYDSYLKLWDGNTLKNRAILEEKLGGLV